MSEIECSSGSPSADENFYFRAPLGWYKVPYKGFWVLKMSTLAFCCCNQSGSYQWLKTKNQANIGQSGNCSLLHVQVLAVIRTWPLHFSFPIICPCKDLLTLWWVIIIIIIFFWCFAIVPFVGLGALKVLSTNRRNCKNRIKWKRNYGKADMNIAIDILFWKMYSRCKLAKIY